MGTYSTSRSRIAISLQVPSEENVFEGKITQITDLGNFVKLKVDVRGEEFVVQTRKRFFEDLKVNVGLHSFQSVIR